MAWEPFYWVIVFLMNMILIASNLYQHMGAGHAIQKLALLVSYVVIVCLTDLEADHMNPYESSSRINAVVVPEMVLQGALCTLFLVTGHWFMSLIALPITCYNMVIFMKRRHLIDVTEVYSFLSAEKKYRIVKLVFYLLLFVLVVFRLIATVINPLIDEGVNQFGMFRVSRL